MSQIHKRFTDDQIKDLFQRYFDKTIQRKYIQQLLGIGKSHFFTLAARYKEKPDVFSIAYSRTTNPRQIVPEAEAAILEELRVEQKLIQNKEVPIRSYNYSYIKDRLADHYHQNVSLPTIISRAKRHGHYLPKPHRSRHDREVLTNYAGELIQHDSSHHLWAPAAREKWYLITSLDDYSRFMLYALLVKKETSWAHIQAVQSVILKYGFPLTYYVDCHSIFRFVQGRDSIWREHHKLTDQVNPQWKQVLFDCNVKITYALSPQAKGKIERPYQWLQDRLVRTCVRNDVDEIASANRFLNQEVSRYNYRQVHSTTGEVPYFRLKKALADNQSLFRSFVLPQPYLSVKDLFCLRTERTVDAYRRISLNNLELKIPGADPHQRLVLRIYPLNQQVAEVRFWFQNRLLVVQKVKISDLQGVQF